MTSDTIFAEATAVGRAGVSVVRLSGPRSWAVVETLCGRLPEPRHAAVRVLRDPETGDVIDEPLVLIFEAGRSFTGQESAEVHLHGSRAVVAAVLEVLSRQPGLRLAEAGEFTRRALQAGRMDLPQVEALADLIAAETTAQRQLAMRVFRGALTTRVADWRRELIAASALIAAVLDFSEEEDVPDDVSRDVIGILQRTIAGLRREAEGSAVGERIRDGFEVAIVGRPNVGKSTLLNAMARRDVALVSEFAGTTRDVIEVRMDLGGLPVSLLDTAGVRDTDDHVEGLGVGRARERAEAADLRLFLVMPGEDAGGLGVAVRNGDLVVGAKADVGGCDRSLGVSGTSGAGIPELLSLIAEELGDRALGASSAIRARHGVAMRGAVVSLESALARMSEGVATLDLASEDIRQSIVQLDILIGRVDLEDILDMVFSNFCIGK